MGSLTQPKIPVIDFTSQDLKPGTTSWTATSRDVCNALADLGCFEAIFDKVPPQIEAAVFDAAKELFGLPNKVKSKTTSNKPNHGYFGDLPGILPLHQGHGIDYVTNMEELHKFTNLMWPEGNDHFSDASYSYSKAVEELNVMVVKMIFDHFGLQKYYESHMASTTYYLRFSKYIPATETQSKLGLPVHKDITFLSILHQNIKALEIETKDGSWISWDYKPFSFLVIAGDVCTGWSNNKLTSCSHRVTMKEKETRYALGLFTFLTGTVKVPEELIDDEHPLKFKPFSNAGLLDFYATDEGLATRPNVVKSYCGI